MTESSDNTVLMLALLNDISITLKGIEQMMIYSESWRDHRDSIRPRDMEWAAEARKERGQRGKGAMWHRNRK